MSMTDAVYETLPYFEVSLEGASSLTSESDALTANVSSKPVTSMTTKENATLPKTGDEASTPNYLVGLGILVGAGLLAKRRSDNESD